MPDRSDADQEGITLSPITAAQMIARQEAQTVILNHLKYCPFAAQSVEPRLRALETRFAALIGLMIGSGLLGGAAGAAIIQAIAK